MKLMERLHLNISHQRIHVAKGTIGSFVIQLGFAGLSFANAMLLGRLLGAEVYGAFANAMAWVSILVVLSTFGFGVLMVKEIAILNSREEWQIFKGLLHFGDRFVLALSILLGLLFVYVSGNIFSSIEQNTMRLTLWASAALIPLLALSNLRMAVIRGLEHVVQSMLPTMIFRPALLTVGIFLIYILCPNKLSAPIAMLVNVFAALFALTASFLWLNHLLPFEKQLYKYVYEIKYWIRTAFPLMMLSSIQIILGQTDIVILGILRGASDVGLYAAAHRLAYTLTYITFAMDVIMAPIMARLYANQERKRLQGIVTSMVRIAFAIVFPFGIILIIAGENILALFGTEFTDAQTTLIIFVIGRLIEIALGSSGLMLSMIGHQDIVAKAFAFTLPLNIALNFLLITRFGLEGAAISSVVSTFVVKMLLGVFAEKREGLHVTIFSSR